MAGVAKTGGGAPRRKTVCPRGRRNGTNKSLIPYNPESAATGAAEPPAAAYDDLP
jgi:hypothetical protein